MASVTPLKSSGALPTQFEAGDTLNPAFLPSSAPVYQSGASVVVSNTTTETALLSCTIPANTLGANGALRIRLCGTYLNNSGSSATLKLKVTYGGTTLYYSTSGSIATSATAHALFLDLMLSGANATNAQTLSGDVTISAPNAPTTGYGNLGTVASATTGANTSVSGTAAVDSTASQTLTITATHSVANASINATALYASVTVDGATGPKGDNGPAGNSGVTINTAQTGAYTFVLTDANCCTPFNSTTAANFTIPANASVAFPLGAVLYVRQANTAAATFVGASGVTVNTPNGAATTAVGDWRCAVNVGTDAWDVV